MGEADRPVSALDHVRGGGRVERLRANPRAPQERLRRVADCRGEGQRLACRRRQPGDPPTQEPLERVGHDERLGRVEVRVEDARQLDREEGIAARLLVNAKQRLTRERSADRLLNSGVQRANAERLHVESPDALGVECLLDRRRGRSVGDATSQQQDHAFPASLRSANASAAADEASTHCTSSMATRIGPARRAGRARCASRARAPVDPRVRLVRFRDQECDLERPPPGRRKRRQHIVEAAFEQITQNCVREPTLGLRGSRRKHAHPARARILDPGEPERRLADAGLTLEHERSRLLVRAADEGLKRGQLLIPADDLVQPPSLQCRH